MARKRRRASGTWEFVVRRQILLHGPLYLSFEIEADGDAYVKRLEALLDKGIVPDEFKNSREKITTIGAAIRGYLLAHNVALSDRSELGVFRVRIGETPLSIVNYLWAESWITKLKREGCLAPTTIRHRVGALARCFDWAERRGVVELIPNPLRRLPRNYSTYNDLDAAAARALGDKPGSDVERDRLILPDEERRIRRILAGEIPKNRQRSR
jgi:hypothetical protein